MTIDTHNLNINTNPYTVTETNERYLPIIEGINGHPLCLDDARQLIYENYFDNKPQLTPLSIGRLLEHQRLYLQSKDVVEVIVQPQYNFRNTTAQGMYQSQGRTLKSIKKYYGFNLGNHPDWDDAIETLLDGYKTTNGQWMLNYDIFLHRVTKESDFLLSGAKVWVIFNNVDFTDRYDSPSNSKGAVAIYASRIECDVHGYQQFEARDGYRTSISRLMMERHRSDDYDRWNEYLTDPYICTWNNPEMMNESLWVQRPPENSSQLNIYKDSDSGEGVELVFQTHVDLS